MKRDPVCGMQVDEVKAEYTSTYKGKSYYFDSAACKKAFDLAPEKYGYQPESDTNKTLGQDRQVGAKHSSSRDPVCDMQTDKCKTKYSSTYKGKNYDFCSAACKTVFDLNPEKYVKE